MSHTAGLCTYAVLHLPPFILTERCNEEEVMASEQEVCTSHTAATVVFFCCHSLCHSDCLLKLTRFPPPMHASHTPFFFIHLKKIFFFYHSRSEIQDVHFFMHTPAVLFFDQSQEGLTHTSLQGISS